jgi:cation-dependent mannose-6-phosphate receptor
VGGFLYLAVGAAYKYKQHGARGADMVPNIDFWRELPSLMKDGVRFVYQKCGGGGGG